MEKAVTIEIKRFNKLPFRLFDVRDVLDVLSAEPPVLFVHVNGLHRIAFFSQLYPCKQGRVSHHRCLNSFAELLCVKTLVQGIKIWQVITGFTCFAGTFCIDSVLCFS